MIPTRVFAAGLLAAASLAAGSASATVSHGGAVHMTALAALDGQPPVADSRGVSLPGIPGEISTFARATTPAGGDSLTARGAMIANWASADRGTVQVANFGWDIQADDPAVTDLASMLTDFTGDRPEWTYSFTATGDGRFDLAADLFGAGVEDQSLAQWDVRFVDNGAASETTLTHGFEGDGIQETTGRFRRNLIAGHDYTVSLVSLDGFSASGPDISFLTGNASENGGMRWSIIGGGNDDAVPEPSVWAMAVLGFGLAGVSLRLRRWFA
jgi:hypothetical protein